MEPQGVLLSSRPAHLLSLLGLMIPPLRQTHDGGTRSRHRDLRGYLVQPEARPGLMLAPKVDHDRVEAVQAEIQSLSAQLEEVRSRSTKNFRNVGIVAETSRALRSPRDVVDQCLALRHRLALAMDDRRYIEFLLQAREIGARLSTVPSLETITGANRDLGLLEASINAEISTGSRLVNLHLAVEQIRSTVHASLKIWIASDVRQQSDDLSWPFSGQAADSNRARAAIKSALRFYEYETILPDVLAVFEVLVQPFVARFQYHFTSKRPTNRLDKPEWLLQHVIALAEQHASVITRHLQSLLDEVLPQHRLLASHEFIRALMPMVFRKLQDNCGHLLDNAPLLFHTITEAKRFDDTLRDDFGFRGRIQSHWTGVCAQILTEDVFAAWLGAESHFARTRYSAIMEDEVAFEIVGDAESSGGEIAANPSALKLIDLFEAMTRRFAPLEDLELRTRFVGAIQVYLLESYLARVQSSTDAFEALTGGFSGGFPTGDIAGKAGLQRLCRQMSGIANVHQKIVEWSEDPYYVVLEAETARPCFERQCQDFSKLQDRIEGMITNHLYAELSQEIRPYTRLRNWDSEEAVAATVASTSTSSTQLIRFYETVATLFGYLASVASTVLIHRIYVSLAKRLDLLLTNTIVDKNEFSRRGALQFKRDMYQMWLTFSTCIARPEAGMRGVCDALAVLSDGKDEQEGLALKLIDDAVSTSSKANIRDRKAQLQKLGITTMSVPEVRALLLRKLFSPA